MQTTALEEPTTMTTLATETTSADNDVRSANNGDNAGYCDILRTLTTMQTTMLEEPTTMIALTTVSTSSHCQQRRERC